MVSAITRDLKTQAQAKSHSEYSKNTESSTSNDRTTQSFRNHLWSSLCKSEVQNSMTSFAFTENAIISLISKNWWISLIPLCCVVCQLPRNELGEGERAVWAAQLLERSQLYLQEPGETGLSCKEKTKKTQQSLANNLPYCFTMQWV